MTFSGHDETLIPHEETPSKITDLFHIESQHVAVISCRMFKVRHGDDIQTKSRSIVTSLDV